MTIEKFAFEQVTSSAGTGDGWIIQCALFREPIAQHCGTKQKTPFSMRHRGLPKPDGLSLRRPSRPTLAEATFRPGAEPELVRVARDTDGARSHAPQMPTRVRPVR